MKRWCFSIDQGSDLFTVELLPSLMRDGNTFLSIFTYYLSPGAYKYIRHVYGYVLGEIEYRSRWREVVIFFPQGSDLIHRFLSHAFIAFSHLHMLYSQYTSTPSSCSGTRQNILQRLPLKFEWTGEFAQGEYLLCFVATLSFIPQLYSYLTDP